MTEPERPMPRQEVRDLTPPEWFTLPEDSSVWMRIYRVIGADEDVLPPGRARVMDLTGLRAIVIHSDITYFGAHHPGIEFLRFDHAIVEPDIGPRESPSGPHLVLLAPFRVDGREGDEGRTQMLLDEAAGLFAAFNGRNMVYQRLTDSIVYLSNPPRTGLSGGYVVDPKAFQVPDVSDERLSIVRTAELLIDRASKGMRARARRSLRWFQNALVDDGVGAFIKCWIALETIGTVNYAKLKPISESLGRSYGIDTDEARERFHLERLISLRDSIMHRGEIPSIDLPLLQFVQALYVDVFLERLGLRPEQRAIAVMQRFDIPSRLDVLVSVPRKVAPDTP